MLEHATPGTASTHFLQDNMRSVKAEVAGAREQDDDAKEAVDCAPTDTVNSSLPPNPNTSNTSSSGGVDTWQMTFTPVLPDDGFSYHRKNDATPSFPTAVSWSCHNVLCVAASRFHLEFSLHDPKRPAAAWSLSSSGDQRREGGVSHAIRQVAWAPTLLPDTHFPPCSSIAVLVGDQIRVAHIARDGDQRVEVRLPAKLVFPPTVNRVVDDESETAVSRQRRIRAAEAWWTVGVEWLSATTLCVVTSQKVFTVALTSAVMTTATASGIKSDASNPKRKRRPRSDEPHAETNSDEDNADDDKESERNEEVNEHDERRCISPSFSEVAIPVDFVTGRHLLAFSKTESVLVVVQQGAMLFFVVRSLEGGTGPRGELGASPPTGGGALQFCCRVCLPPAEQLLEANCVACADATNLALHRGAASTRQPNEKVLTLHVHVCFSACVVRYTVDLRLPCCTMSPSPSSSSVDAAGVGLGSIVHRLLYRCSEDLFGEMNWRSIMPLMCYPPQSAEERKSKRLHQLSSPAGVSATQTDMDLDVTVLLGSRNVVALVEPWGGQHPDWMPSCDDALAAAHVAARCVAPHCGGVACLLFECPTGIGHAFPTRRAALSPISWCLHPSLQVCAVLLRTVIPRGQTLRLLLHSARDAHACPFAGFFHAIQLWKAYGRVVTPYSKQSFFAREYILRATSTWRSLTQYHERHTVLTALGNGLSAESVAASVTWTPTSFVLEAAQTRTAQMGKYLAYRRQYGPELFLRQGWTAAATTGGDGGATTQSRWHWRVALLTMLRAFRGSDVASELVLGAAIVGLRRKAASHSQGAGSGTDAFSVASFCCENALSYIRSYATALGRGSANLLRSSSEDENQAFAASLSKLAVDVERYLSRVVHVTAPLENADAAQTRTTEGLSSFAGACSVCNAPIASLEESLPLSLKLHRHSCAAADGVVMAAAARATRSGVDDVDAMPRGRPAASHTTVLSPVTFRTLHLFDPDALMGRCKCCNFYDEIRGATCMLCDGLFA